MRTYALYNVTRRSARTILATIIGALLVLASESNAQTPRFADKIFFYNDIYHFVGKPYRSPSFADMHTLSQPFLSKCANLNRLIIPFFLDENTKSGKMRFNLYQVGKQNEPLFIADIDIAQFPAPSAIGSHSLLGVLHPIWIPPLADSENSEFIWEIVTDSSDPLGGVGLYLTNSPAPQLQPALIDGAKSAGSIAFFSYCQYQFEWGKILSLSEEKLRREKYFLAAYMALMGGILFLIPRLK